MILRNQARAWFKNFNCPYTYGIEHGDIRHIHSADFQDFGNSKRVIATGFLLVWVPRAEWVGINSGPGTRGPKEPSVFTD